MREVITQKNDTTTVIKTPWLSGDDACVYMGISRSEFFRTVAPHVPFKQIGRIRKYNIADLDTFSLK